MGARACVAEGVSGMSSPAPWSLWGWNTAGAARSSTARFHASSRVWRARSPVQTPSPGDVQQAAFSLGPVFLLHNEGDHSSLEG